MRQASQPNGKFANRVGTAYAMIPTGTLKRQKALDTEESAGASQRHVEDLEILIEIRDIHKRIEEQERS